MTPPVTFYFDLGSPYAYLASERIDRVLGRPAQWQPVLLGALFKATGRSSWALADHRRREAGMAEVERRAREYALPPVLWPDPWPTDYLHAMLATTFAFAAGRGREFAVRAFANAFQLGWELSSLERVLATGVEIGLDRGELEAATRDPEIKSRLRAATDAALARGVFGVPTIAVGEQLLWGDDRLGNAAALLRRPAEASARDA